MELIIDKVSYAIFETKDKEPRPYYYTETGEQAGISDHVKLGDKLYYIGIERKIPTQESMQDLLLDKYERFIHSNNFDEALKVSQLLLQLRNI